ncbi:MAG TPA: hypothetical protein VIS51_08925 [Solirubrobacterales bacterium]
MVPPENPPDAEKEVARHLRVTLAGSYLDRALKELRASGSPDTLYEPRFRNPRDSRPVRGALGRRLATSRQREATRSAVLFAMLAAEAYVNQFLEIHLTGAEADAADRLPTFEKFMMGPRLADGTDLFDRGAEPAGTLKKLLNQRTPLVHPKLAPPKSQGPTYTPLEAAEFIVAVANAAITLIANSDPRPKLDLAIVAVQETPDYFLDYGRRATEGLPDPDGPPSPDLVLEILTRMTEKEMEEAEEGRAD